MHDTKKEITPEFMWHLDQLVLTFQVAIVTTVDEHGRVNAAPFGLVLPFCSDPENPQMLLCSNSVWHTAQNIETTGEFVLNYTSRPMLEKTAQTGLLYPEGTNELEKAGLSPIDSLAVRPPRIQECFQHIECRVNHVMHPSEHQSNFVGDILSITADADLIDKDQDHKLKAADPLLLFGMDITTLTGNYAGVGKTTAYAPPRTDVE